MTNTNPFNLSNEDLAQLFAQANAFAANPTVENSIPGPVIDATATETKAVKVNIAWRIVRWFNRAGRRAIDWVKAPPTIITTVLIASLISATTFAGGYLFFMFFTFLYSISHILAWSVLGALVAQLSLMLLAGMVRVLQYTIMRAL